MESSAITIEDFILAIEADTLRALKSGLYPASLAIALRLRADELDEMVPPSQAYK